MESEALTNEVQTGDLSQSFAGAALDLPSSPEDTVREFRAAIQAGEPWFASLLEAVRRWRWSQETVQGRVYQYLIGGEAFDWLVLAERLCDAARDLLPEREVESLLFYGQAPAELVPAELKRGLGIDKYRAHLNYLYGVTVEEALQLAVAQEVQKERHAQCYKTDLETVHQRIYNATEVDLLHRFRAERFLSSRQNLTFSEYREFIYWLFKYRLHRCHPARVASDTKKGLLELQRQRLAKGLSTQAEPEPEEQYLEQRGADGVL